MNNKAEQTTGLVAYMGAGGTTVWGFNADEWGIIGVIAGIILTVIMMGINTYYKQKNLEINKKRYSGQT